VPDTFTAITRFSSGARAGRMGLGTEAHRWAWARRGLRLAGARRAAGEHLGEDLAARHLQPAYG